MTESRSWDDEGKTILRNETKLDYDANGNLTKATSFNYHEGKLTHSQVTEYDALIRWTKATTESPEGETSVSTCEYTGQDLACKAMTGGKLVNERTYKDGVHLTRALRNGVLTETDKLEDLEPGLHGHLKKLRWEIGGCGIGDEVCTTIETCSGGGEVTCNMKVVGSDGYVFQEQESKHQVDGKTTAKMPGDSLSYMSERMLETTSVFYGLKNKSVMSVRREFDDKKQISKVFYTLEVTDHEGKEGGYEIHTGESYELALQSLLSGGVAGSTPGRIEAVQVVERDDKGRITRVRLESLTGAELSQLGEGGAKEFIREYYP